MNKHLGLTSSLAVGRREISGAEKQTERGQITTPSTITDQTHENKLTTAPHARFFSMRTRENTLKGIQASDKNQAKMKTK